MAKVSSGVATVWLVCILVELLMYLVANDFYHEAMFVRFININVAIINSASSVKIYLKALKTTDTRLLPIIEYKYKHTNKV